MSPCETDLVSFAAEEMSAQAEQLKEYVDELVMMVTGRKTEGKKAAGHHLTKHVISKPRVAENPKRTALSHQSKEVRSDQVIPFYDDEDFKNF